MNEDRLVDAGIFLESALSEYIDTCVELGLDDEQLKNNVLDILVTMGIEL